MHIPAPAPAQGGVVGDQLRSPEAEASPYAPLGTHAGGGVPRRRYRNGKPGSNTNTGFDRIPSASHIRSNFRDGLTVTEYMYIFRRVPFGRKKEICVSFFKRFLMEPSRVGSPRCFSGMLNVYSHQYILLYFVTTCCVQAQASDVVHA